MSLTGYAKACGKNPSGIYRIGVIEAADFTAATVDPTDGTYSAVTLANGSTFAKYEFDQDQAEYQESRPVIRNSRMIFLAMENRLSIRSFMRFCSTLLLGIMTFCPSHRSGNTYAPVDTRNDLLWLNDNFTGHVPSLRGLRVSRYNFTDAIGLQRICRVLSPKGSKIPQSSPKLQGICNDFYSSRRGVNKKESSVFA